MLFRRNFSSFTSSRQKPSEWKFWYRFWSYKNSTKFLKSRYFGKGSVEMLIIWMRQVLFGCNWHTISIRGQVWVFSGVRGSFNLFFDWMVTVDSIPLGSTLFKYLAIFLSKEVSFKVNNFLSNKSREVLPMIQDYPTKVPLKPTGRNSTNLMNNEERIASEDRTIKSKVNLFWLTLGAR